MWEEESRSYPVATQFKADPKPRFKPSSQSTPPSPSPSRNLRSVRSLAGKTSDGASGSSGGQGAAAVSPGTVISHDRFGVGEVLRVEGTGENTKITVNFRNIGVKQLLVKFARFQVVG